MPYIVHALQNRPFPSGGACLFRIQLPPCQAACVVTVGVASTSAVEGEEAACSTICSAKSLATGAVRGRPLREEARGEEDCAREEDDVREALWPGEVRGLAGEEGDSKGTISPISPST